MVRPLFLTLFLSLFFLGSTNMNPNDKDKNIQDVINEVKKKTPESEHARLERGVKLISSLWRAEDGDIADFIKENFITDKERLEKTFERLIHNFEVLYGNMLVISREFAKPLHLDWGEPLKIDYIFAEYNPAAHIVDDFFKNKLAFIILLNFPSYELRDKLLFSEMWDRRSWAMAKLSEPFRDRVPAEINQQLSKTFARVDNYISEYNIYMGNLIHKNKTYFPKELKLISHWGLRDEIKAQYAKEAGLERQEIIYQVMKNIIEGRIPREVINSDKYLYDPFENKVYDKENKNEVGFMMEGNRRYENFKMIFDAQRLLDKYTPGAPTHIARRFNRERQIPEEQVEQLLLSVLNSDIRKGIAKLIEKRLKRRLRPFDIWYAGFKPSARFKEDELDKIVRQKYPTLEVFARDIPNILQKLGFEKEMADFLSAHIEVEPARGAGHAMGADMKRDKAHLRTRVPKGGMDYKGFNIAMHELGHCVEQVLTLNRMDYYPLRGVPNTAFTESFAFMFQARDLFVLGLDEPSEEAENLRVLEKFWATYEIAGVSLVDMYVWRWMYKNPEAKPEELKKAVLEIAKDVWNKYYSPIFKIKEEPILAIYSHMIDAALYLPDYPIGHIIDFQIENYIKGKNLAKEMERMCKAGSVLPNLWMKHATGEEITAKPLLEAASNALKKVK
ncbi:MAG: hypothetical protein N2746_11110 [Deltaproteobacteria bacterium]|nr:hypothetical protein [Deltaproteobacteria bacterium]